MPPSASCAPTSLVRSLLKPTTHEADEGHEHDDDDDDETGHGCISSVLDVLGLSSTAGRSVERAAHQEPPPPPPPPPPPENPPPPPPLEDEVWVAW